MRVARLPLAAALAAAFALLPSHVAAQAQTATPDEGELTTFAEVFVEISEVREEVTPRIMQAETPEEAAQVEQEANMRMLEILESHELEAERYNQITQLINADEDLRARFEAVYADVIGDDGA